MLAERWAVRLAMIAYRVPSPLPSPCPVAENAGRGEVAEVDVPERIGDIAHFAAFGPVGGDGHEGQAIDADFCGT